MKLWKTLAVASLAMAFGVGAHASCGGVHQAMKTASNAAAKGKVATNNPPSHTLPANKVAANEPAGK
jgi:hypothetical protein